MATTNQIVDVTRDNSYFGGKSGAGTYQTIINQIPPHSIRVSLFGGFLGVERRLKPAKKEFAIELDPKTFQKYEKWGYYRNVQIDTYDSIADQQVWMRAAMWREGKFGFLADTLELLPLLTHPEIWDLPEVFIYVDPPYPMDSRKDPRSRYKHELTDEQHRELLAQLTSFHKANIAISTYPNEMYNDWLWDHEFSREWREIKFQSMTRKGTATEQLWMNYPEPAELHDYSYLGDNYRERERIARQKRRWVGKFKKLAALEQRGLLQAMHESIPTEL